jgi:hypothetical protein
MRISKYLINFFFILIFSALNAFGQPYFEPVSISGSYFPKGENQPLHGEKVFNLNFSVPVRLTQGVLLVLSPFQEYRGSYHADNLRFPDLFSTAIPVSLLNYLNDSNWVVNITVINRWNQTEWEFKSGAWQIGGAVINTVKVHENLKLKFGLYYNREFFSDFFVPLGGIDWKISERMNLFSTLPNHLKLEYQILEDIYAGAVFKSLTNSYKNFGDEEGYYKVTDNQIGLFADAVLTGKIVMTLEAGHTFFKTTKSRIPDSFYERKTDSFYLKAGLSYRIRFTS